MVSLFEFVCGSVHGCCMRIDSQKLTARVASSNSTLWQGRSRQTFRLVLACPDICLRVPKLNRTLEVQYVRRGPRAAAFRSSAHYVGNVSYDHVTHWLFKVDRESNHALRVHVNTLVSRGNPEFQCLLCMQMDVLFSLRSSAGPYQETVCSEEGQGACPALSTFSCSSAGHNMI